MDEGQIISSFGYGVYSIPQGKIAIADPLDNSEGFYLVVDTIDEAYKEMRDLELVSPGRR